MRQRLSLGIALWIGVGLAGSVSLASHAQPRSTSFSRERPDYQGAAAATGSDSRQALLKRYCITCHNERLKTGDLALDTLDLEQRRCARTVWEKVVRKLRAGVMPPAGRPRPDEATHDAFVAWLEGELDRTAASRPEPGAHRNVPPAESVRVSERDSRSAGDRGEHRRPAAGRRFKLRLRQHRGRPADLTGADGALSVRGEDDQPPGGRGAAAGRGPRGLSRGGGYAAARSRRGSAAWHARRLGGAAYVSPRWRVRHQG